MDIVHKLLGLTLLGAEWVLWLLILLSILSVAIILERMVYFSKIKIDFAHFSRELGRLLVDNDMDGVQKLCGSSPALEAQVVMQGVAVQKKGSQAMEENMTSYLVGSRQNLDKGLIILGTLGNNAPFIGLFGTVIGIIKAFNDLSTNPAGGPSVVMAGISEALIATAVGLIVAIPAVVAFNSFQRVVKRHYANAESMIKLMMVHTHHSK